MLSREMTGLEPGQGDARRLEVFFDFCFRMQASQTEPPLTLSEGEHISTCTEVTEAVCFPRVCPTRENASLTDRAAADTVRESERE